MHTLFGPSTVKVKTFIRFIRCQKSINILFGLHRVMIPGDIQSLAPDVKGGYSCKGLLNDRLCSSLNECQAAIILHNFCTFFESAPCNTSDTLCLYVRSAGRLLLDPTLSASSKWRALSGWRWIVEILLRVILLFACGLIWPFTTAQASAVLQIDKL